MSAIVAGVDLGGTSVRVALADQTGTLLLQSRFPTESQREPLRILRQIGEQVRELQLQLGCGKLAGLGIGVPGLVEMRTGTTRFLPNFPGHWRDVRVAEFLQQELACPVRVLNDARTATLGELRFGHGRELPGVTMAWFGLGTGVGGGVVIDGQLRTGSLGAAGELGHQTVVPNGVRCGCGNIGCLETVVGGPAVTAAGVRLLLSGQAPELHRIVSGRTERVSPATMMQAAGKDAAIRGALVSIAELLGIAAANVVTVLHPDLVVLGGGLAEIGNLLTETVQRVIRDRVGMFPADNVRVELSALGPQAGLVGAVALALDESATC